MRIERLDERHHVEDFTCGEKSLDLWLRVHALANQQFPTGHGSHATPSEIAVTQWAYPGSIKTAAYSPQIAPSGPIREANDFRARYADGRMGSDPAQATPEKGGELVALAAKSLLDDVAEFAAEPNVR